MKDLALPDHSCRSCGRPGVSCFKIEGRKKSPLYVATTTDYYRKLLDGTLADDDRPIHEADLQTVFSRPWTRLFVQSHKDKEVADRDTVGHRGTRIGEVETVRMAGKGDRACASMPAGPWSAMTACRSICPGWANRSASLSISSGFVLPDAALDQAQRGVRSSGGGAGRGRFAGRPSATAGRRTGVLLVVAGGEAPLSAQPAQARALPRAPRRRHRGRGSAKQP